MISFEEAQRLILDTAERLGTKKILLRESLGYVLAEDVKADFDIPPFNKSAMDGYAIKHEDVKTPLFQLYCKGEIAAGNVFKDAIKKGECVKIMTGSPLPDTTDSVIMVEHTKENKKTKIVEFFQSVEKGENVCIKGEEVKAGMIVLKKGTHMRIPELSTAASLGKTQLKVYRKPKVSVLSTGNEILEQNEKFEFGKIYNSNGPMLSALLSGINIEYEYLGIAKDTEADLTVKIRKGLQNNILLLSGGVSMGDYDLAPSVLKKCGVKEVFHKVAIKPGKPLFFGHSGKTLIYGLPGNPVSVFLNFLVNVKPAIDKMIGKIPSHDIEKGILMNDYRNKPGRKNFVPVMVKKSEEKTEVYPVKHYHGSGDISALTRANSFMIIEKDVSFINKNSIVEILPWKI